MYETRLLFVPNFCLLFYLVPEADILESITALPNIAVPEQSAVPELLAVQSEETPVNQIPIGIRPLEQLGKAEIENIVIKL